MSELYNNLYGSRKKKHKSPFATLVDAIAMVVTIPVALLFLVLLFVPSINPNSAGILSTLGLVAPFIYALLFVLTLYWLLRWRWMAVPMAILSIIGMFSLTLFFRPEVKRYYDKQYPRNAIRVLTYNTRSFINDNGERCVDSVGAMIRAINPDIVCFQEMGFSGLVDSVLQPLKYRPLPKSLSRVNLSPMIYSRHPIVRAARIDTMRNFAWADVVIRKDTIRVFNTHLHTTAIRRDEERYIKNHQYLAEDGDIAKLRSIVGRLSENNKQRSVQVDTIAQIIAASPYPVVVCGDFNDIPISYTYRHMSDGLNDAFRSVGRGYSSTYRGFFDLLRIDYVLYDDNFLPLGYDVLDSWVWADHVRRNDTIRVRKYGYNLKVESEENDRGPYKVDYSDHYPVLVHLEMNR